MLIATAMLMMLTAAARPARAAQPASAPSAGTPDATEIARAIERVKADPNLATERTIKTLRWKASPRSTPRRMPAWLAWIGGFFRWLGESARVLIWCAALGLAGLLAVYLARIARTRLERSADGTFVVPTHVRDLDIRPETLPDDIGAAARQLWERGERRAALALLYRGMLSRLAHVHGVPIRESSTEGDCLALAAARLPQDRSEYLARLVRIWQRFGYGRQHVEATAVYSLCDEFAAALRPVPAGDAALQRGPM
jgi:hypothetical protein